MNNFIDEQYINNLLAASQTPSKHQISLILEKANKMEGLNHREVAVLLQIEDEKQIEELHRISHRIKKEYYGDRIVLFAPLYISNHCVNNCSYCGYKRDNDINRVKLSLEQIKEEVIQLQAIGHKRIALEVGEDSVNTDINYVAQAIKTIYDSGDIRRINVNVAATTQENYKILADLDIGTYILFQETYHQKTYHDLHPESLKQNYERQLFAHHHAINAGLEDVGGGVLLGLYDYQFDLVAMLLHNEKLFEEFNVEFHTMSVPRLKPANGVDLSTYPHLIDDETFIKIVSILRIAAPHVGIILSTREDEAMRRKLINQGISQISANSKTTVGGYSEEESAQQFELGDERTLLQTIKDLINDGNLPSYCTACYRMNRTGKEFHDQVSSKKIALMCHPNAILTTLEYVIESKDIELYKAAYPFLLEQLEKIKDEQIQTKTKEYFTRIENGARDLYI